MYLTQCTVFLRNGKMNKLRGTVDSFMALSTDSSKDYGILWPRLPIGKLRMYGFDVFVKGNALRVGINS